MQIPNQINPLKPDKFKNKYRINSTRWESHNYSSDGIYFITICIKNRKCLFGNIKENQMFLSPYGKIAEDFLKEIPTHYPFIILEEFVVMPNHVHSILIIDKEYSWDGHKKPEKDGMVVECRDEALPRLYTGDYPEMSEISPKPESVSSIIGSYKSAVSKAIHRFDPNFHWQSRFYDIIIKNPDAHNKIRWYILNNVLRWDEDRNNPRFFETVK